MGRIHETTDIKKKHYKMGTALDEKKKIEILREVFREKVGYELNLSNPKGINEKIMWYKLYYQNPLIVKCCDKFAVKEYVSETIGSQYIVPTIASWNSADEIDFDSLPKRFVLKVNWSSGYNIIVKDKEKLDINAARDQIREWMKPDRNSYYQFFNWGYKHVKPIVYAEKYLDQIDGQVYDYKFFVCGGSMKYMLIATDRGNDNNLTYDFFDRDFNHLPIYQGDRKHVIGLLNKPTNFDLMIELSEKLAKPFPFVRVDFYEIDNSVFIGEMTFYPGGGILRYTPEEWDFKLGELVPLPEKMITDDEHNIIFKAKSFTKKIEMKAIDGVRFVRKNVIYKERRDDETFIRVLGLRIPYKTHIETEGRIIRHWVNVLGVELQYRKSSDFTQEEPNTNIIYHYYNNSPKEAFLMENQVDISIQKIHCEQKAYKQLGYFPDLTNPKSFNEKIIWLALYYKNPNIAIAADKSRAKKWIEERIGTGYVIPAIGVYNSIQELNFNKLPNQFVAKLNDGWGSDEIMIVRDKTKLDVDKTKAILSSWLYPWKNYYYQNLCVTDEKMDRPRILIEKYVSDGDNQYLQDYKLFCCNGDPKFVLLVDGRGSEEQTNTFVTLDWEVIPVSRLGKDICNIPKKPITFEIMIELAKKLSKDFPFVRIDFYEVLGKTYVGEMTFTPGMFLKFEPRAWDYKFGDYLDISRLVEAQKNIS